MLDITTTTRLISLHVEGSALTVKACQNGNNCLINKGNDIVIGHLLDTHHTASICFSLVL